MEDKEIPLDELSEKEKKKYLEYEEPKSKFSELDAVTPLEIINRDAWGAAPPTSRELVCTPMGLAMILDTRTEPCYNTDQCLSRVKELQTFYMEKKGLPDIPWNFLVGGDGHVYQGRGWVTKSSKLTPETEPFDGESIDMAYIGDFRETVPPKEMTLAAKDLFELAAVKNVLSFAYDLRSEIMVDFVEKEVVPPKTIRNNYNMALVAGLNNTKVIHQAKKDIIPGMDETYPAIELLEMGEREGYLKPGYKVNSYILRG